MTGNAHKAGIVQWLSLCYQCVLILFFSYTLVNKGLGFADFEFNIHKTGLYPLEMIRPVACAVLIVESLAIGLLVWNSLWGYRFALIMMAIFTGYICLLYSLGRYEVCGCGGILNGLPFYSHLAINIIVVLSLIVALVYEKYSQSNIQRA